MPKGLVRSDFRTGLVWMFTCPVCEFEYTHHGLVEVFQRPMEDGTTYKGGQPVEFSPSPRRDAVRVYFQGECGHCWWVDIVQHKGQTFLVIANPEGPEHVF